MFRVEPQKIFVVERWFRKVRAMDGFSVTYDSLCPPLCLLSGGYNTDKLYLLFIMALAGSIIWCKRSTLYWLASW